MDRIIGVDINAAMHPYARQAADRARVGSKLQLLLGAAEALPLPDRCADAVVLTHVSAFTLSLIQHASPTKHQS